ANVVGVPGRDFLAEVTAPVAEPLIGRRSEIGRRRLHSAAAVLLSLVYVEIWRYGGCHLVVALAEEVTRRLIDVQDRQLARQVLVQLPGRYRRWRRQPHRRLPAVPHRRLPAVPH